MSRPRVPLDVRFWRKVDKSAGPRGCWRWTGGKSDSGYGVVTVTQRTDGRNIVRTAHSVAYSLTCGEIFPGLVLRHSCDTPLCVNPAHLIVGTQVENMRECVARGRHRSAKRASA